MTIATMVMKMARFKLPIIAGAVLLLAVSFLIFRFHRAPAPQSPKQEVMVESKGYPWPDMKVSDLVTLTNEARKENGAPELTELTELDQSATDKCTDMVTRDYYSHNTPDGQEPWAFIEKRYPQYNHAAENLAASGVSPKFIITSWLNSPGHRRNLLEARFTKVGFGVCKADKFQGRNHLYVIVQHLAN